MRIVENIFLVLALICQLLTIILIFADLYEDDKKDIVMFCLSLSSVFYSLCILINRLTT